MLHAYLCSVDEGVKKHRPEALKSMKIELRGLQHPFKKQLQSDTASEEAFEPQFYRKSVIFQWFLVSKTKPKSKKNCWKCDAKKQYIFQSIFIGIFFALASENGAKIQCFSDLYRKNWFCKNHCFSWGKLLFFWFRASKNRPNFDVKKLLKMTSKKRLEHRIWASILASQNHQNCSKKQC